MHTSRYVRASLSVMRQRRLAAAGSGTAADAPPRGRSAGRAAHVAVAWVVVFFLLHVYWYAGGALGSAGALPPLVPHSLGGWILEVLVVSAFPIAAGVCVVIARGG